MAKNAPFRVAPSIDRNPRGQYVSPPTPAPMAVRQMAERAGTDMQSVGMKVVDHPAPASNPNAPMQPWPAVTPGASNPMRLKG